jgi:FlaA1/EpsC-like NDP-sugar epimerase
MSSFNKIDDYKKYFKNKRILITGGTGSFGKWITRKLLQFNPQEIRIYSRDEEKQLDMDREFNDKRLKYVIGDIRNINRLDESLKDVDILYHAAALKIVPVCEEHPFEAIQTNIIGTRNVKIAAIENKVKSSVLISTDKAVKPINLYGMTKAIAEKEWVNNYFERELRFSVVRYGNVIGSRGSVIPYFKQLISEKKELPITHVDMTRFLISLDEAINLVFYATIYPEAGRFFVPKIPACKVVDLAKVLSSEDYPIKITGIRPGEKINECLVQEDEFRRVEEKEDLFIIHPYGKYDSGIVQREFTSDNTHVLNKSELRKLLNNN